MSLIYYAVRFRLDHKDRWLIWHTNNGNEGNEPDGVVTDHNGLVLVFRSQQRCMTYAGTSGLNALDEHNSAFFNLDIIEKWLRRKRPAKLDCAEFLNTWNLLNDISATLGADFDPDYERTSNIYRKMFWGSNIPAVTPEGRRYEPLWTGKESKIIRQVFRDGLLMFRSHTSEI